MTEQNTNSCEVGVATSWMPDGNGGLMPCPHLLTEAELIRFLRIPEISKARDHHNVIANLKRYHNLPRIHICHRALYSLDAVLDWIREKTEAEGIR